MEEITSQNSSGISQIKITVIIPTFNREGLILRALDSVFCQTRLPDEIIVVDDGSTDNTGALIANYDREVTYLYQDNSGPSVARNLGAREAKNEWLAFLDSDDRWFDDHLSRMENAIFQTTGKANYYFADTILPPDMGGGSLWHSLGFTIPEEFQFRRDGSDWALMGMQPMMLQSSVFNRTAFLAAGGFLENLHYSEDTHMFLRLGLEQPLCAVAGISTEMHGDDDPANRLTIYYRTNKLTFEKRSMMLEDLMLKMPDLPPASKEVLCTRLTNARWSMARSAWRNGEYGEFLNQVRHTFQKGSKRHLANRLFRIGNRDK